MEKKHRFSIKKYSIGVVSVCVGFAFLAGPAPSVQADTLVQPVAEESKEGFVSVSNQGTVQEAPSLVQNENGESAPLSSPSVEEKQESIGTETVEAHSSVTTASVANPIQTEEVRTSTRSRRSVSDTRSTASEDTALQLLENHATLTADRRIAELTDEEKTELKGILFTNFETKADQVALTGVVIPRVKADSTLASGLTSTEIVKHYAPELGRLKRESGVTNPTPEMIRQAVAFAVDAANRVLYQDATLEALAPAAKSTFEKILSHNQMEVLTSQTGLTIAQLKNDLPALYRAILFLEQQYSFEDDLVHTLVFSPEQINNRPSDGRTAYDRLIVYGGNPTDKLRQMSMLYNIAQFRDRKIGEFTGTSSPVELIEVLARKRNQDPATYFEERTEAVVGASAGLRVYDLLKKGQPDYLLPLLSQGKGLYAAGATKSVTIGMLDSYKKLYSENDLLPHVRGTAQNPQPFFQGILPYQENWLQFLESVKKTGTEVPITLAVDTMRVYRPNAQNSYVWSAEAGVNAAPAVVSFFSPMRLWQTEVNMEGQASSEALIRAFSRHFMHPDLSGVKVYTHEMTHTNDQVRLFGGVYRASGRRTGQGPEVYARGLFEVVNNSQTGALAEKPLFTLNTAIPITDAANQRTQASQPHTSKETLEVYMKNLMDLVAYLEAVEAKVALATLTDEEEAVYFNRVSQVERSGNPHSTNDAFLPFGKQGAPAYVSATSVADLVDQDAVSGQFIPSNLTPFHDNLKHNGYYSVPLLESFYAVSQAEDGKNTVGDVSFRRHAYEILGWKGWDAFVTYLSDQTASDREAFKLILKDNQGDWASFKKAQYERLLKTQLDTNLKAGKDLEDNLKTAIQADLQTIREYRRQLEQGAVQPAFLPLRATAVRAVKFAVLNEALKLNDLTTSVLKEVPTETNILYVKNNGGGNGLSPDSPLSSLAEAVQKAKDGYIIRLVGNVTERLPLQIDKKVTIESEGTSPYALTFNTEIKASQHVTFKNLTLKGVLDAGASGPIYLEKGAVFDSVSTLISPRQSNQRPRLIIGEQAGATGTETTSVRIINANDTAFDTITVQQPTDLHVDSNVRVLTSVQITTDQPVAVTSASKDVRSIQATDPSQVTVTLDGASPTDLVLENIQTLHLTNGSQVSLSETVGSPITDSLMLDQGTRLYSPVALAFDTLSGGGNLEFPIRVGEDALKVTRVTGASGASSSEASPTIAFKYRGSLMDYDGVTFVRVAESSTVTPTVKLTGNSDIDLSAQPDANGASYTYQAGYSNYYVFEPEDDQLPLPDGLIDLTPENQIGSLTPLSEPLPPNPDSYTDPTTNEKWKFDRWDSDTQNSNDKRKVYVGIWRRLQDSSEQKTHTVTLDFIYNGQSVDTRILTNVAHGDAITKDTVSQSLPSVTGGRYAISDGSYLSQLTDITSDRRVSIPLSLWHTVTLEYMAGTNKLSEKVVDVKHGDAITKDTVSQSLPPVIGGRYAISDGSALSGLTNITIDRLVSIPLTLWHTVTLEYMAGINKLSDKVVDVKHGENVGMELVRNHIPDGYIISDTFPDQPQLKGVSIDRRIIVPLVKLFDKQSINRVEIVTQPTKVAYDEGERVNLEGLVLKLTDKNNLSQHVSPQDFETFGVQVSPTLSTPLAKTVDKLVFQVGNVQAELRISVYQLVTQELPFSIVYEADEKLPATTQKDKQQGSNGQQTIRLLNGKQVGDAFHKKEPTPRIVLVGTAPIRVESEPLPFDKEEERDANLTVEESYLKQEGKVGRRELWSVFVLNKEKGELTSTEKAVIVKPSSQVAVVGTRIEPQRTLVQRIELISIPFETREIKDSSLPLGIRRVEQKGQLGQQYQKVQIVDIVDGKESVKVVERGVLVPPTEEIVRVGTGPVAVVPQPLPQPLPDTSLSPSDTVLTPQRPTLADKAIISNSSTTQVEKQLPMTTPEKPNREWGQLVSSVPQKRLPNTGDEEASHLLYLGVLSGMFLLADRTVRKRKS